MPDRVTRVLALRHGETDWNVAARIQGQLDLPLNDKGRWQASRLACAIADDGIAAIYASDLQRAAQTAEALAGRAGLAVTTDRDLRERGFGVFEGHTYDDIARRWPDEARRWRQRDPAFGPAGGETLSAFYARSVAGAARLAAHHPGQTIALVAHGGVLDCLYRAATRASLQAARTWQLGNASINRLLHGAEGFILVGWNDATHLDGDAVAPSGMAAAAAQGSA